MSDGLIESGRRPAPSSPCAEIARRRPRPVPRRCGPDHRLEVIEKDLIFRPGSY